MNANSDVELARDMLERMGIDGPETVLDRVHEDFEMSTPSDLASEPQTYRGHKGFMRWWESFYEVMDEIRIEPVEVVQGAPGYIACKFQLTARGQASGVEVSQHAAMICTIIDQSLLKIEYFHTFDEALAEARSR